MYKPMSREKIRYMRKLYAQGRSVLEIADLFRIKPATAERLMFSSEIAKTHQEIPDPAFNASTNPLCKKCKHRVSLGSGAGIACYYYVRTGERRGCSPKDCKKFEKGTPPKERIPIPRERR